MKFKSQLVTQASGSIGGATFSRNAGGMYIRARAVPTNPNTPGQAQVRGLLADLANRWNNTLSGAQREAWKVYSDQVPLVNSLGEAVKVGPLPMYIRSNVSRLQVGLSRIDAAPTTFNTGDFTPPTIGAIDASAGTLSLGFTNTDEWAAEAGSSLLVYISRPQNESIGYFKGPYQYAGRVNGNATPPTSPASITLPFAVTAGNKVFVQARVSRTDGRLSTTFQGGGVAVP